MVSISTTTVTLLVAAGTFNQYINAFSIVTPLSNLRLNRCTVTVPQQQKPHHHCNGIQTFLPAKNSDEEGNVEKEEGYLDNLKTNWDDDVNDNDDNTTTTNSASSVSEEGNDTSNDSGSTIIDENEESSKEYLNNLKTSWDENDDVKKSNSINDNNDEKTKLIQSLLVTAASSDRGQFASNDQKSKMEEIIVQLESSQQAKSDEDSTISSTTTISNPTQSSSIQGTWELLYSSTQLFRSSPFFMAGRAVCQTEEEAKRYDWFCDMHRAALAISEIGKVRQIIGPTRMVSEFEVSVGAVPFVSDFTPFAYSGGLPFTIEGAIVSSADITPTSNGNAWEIFMDTVEIKGSNIPLLRRALDEGVKLQSRGLGSFLESNVPAYSNPKPIFETTYLDDMLRISRDQDGKIFVYGKLSDETEPTNYDDVDADLGLLQLLEGLNDNFFKFSI